MEPLTILRADPLDLLFENRNKAYGAYPLRKYYAMRLLISLGIVISGVVLISFIYLHFRGLEVLRSKRDVQAEVTLISVDQIQPVKPRAPPSRPTEPKPPATAEFLTPVIVSDPPAGSVIATLEDLDNHDIGLLTSQGELGRDQQPGGGDGSGVTANATDSTENNPEIFEHPERMPEFPGGPEALKQFLQRNLRMPENNLEAGTQVKVIARFVVGPDGRVRDVETNQAADEIFNREVRRVILKMPEWKPGMQHNRNVAVYFSLPVNFVAEE
jgi:protein TonB